MLEARDVTDAVLAGHSMGGMTIMALATYRPEVLAARARAIVLVATAAADMSVGSARADRLAARLIGSPLVARALRSPERTSLRAGRLRRRSACRPTWTSPAPCSPTVIPACGPGS